LHNYAVIYIYIQCLVCVRDKAGHAFDEARPVRFAETRSAVLLVPVLVAGAVFAILSGLATLVILLLLLTAAGVLPRLALVAALLLLTVVALIVLVLCHGSSSHYSPRG
jgi:hypothetical protein